MIGKPLAQLHQLYLLLVREAVAVIDLDILLSLFTLLKGAASRVRNVNAHNARVIGIADGETAVGVALVKDLDEEPACYDLQQFLIDRRFQGRGYGTEALRMILSELEAERKYGCAEVCVKRDDATALRVYEKVGFTDTGYVDPDAPDCLNLMYVFR